MEAVLVAAVGWVIAIVNGAVNFFRMRSLRRDLRDARAEGRAAAQALPEQVATVLQSVLPAQGTDVQPPNAPARVKWQDVTGDGDPELLVEHGVGAHSAVLRVFGKLDEYGDFEQIGELFTDHGGFSVSDFDGDGRIEIRALSTDYDAWTHGSDEEPGHSMARPPLVETIWRWNGADFDRATGRKWDTLREPVRPSWADFWVAS